MVYAGTRQQTADAWRKVLTAELPEVVTAAQVAEVVGLAASSARQWLTRNVGASTLGPGRTGGLVGTWQTAEVRRVVAELLEAGTLGPGNRLSGDARRRSG